MSTIIVIGHVNHDRIWRLDRPIKSGARIRYSDREVRLGGGAYHTGEVLVSQGHKVIIVTNLMNDDKGRAAMQTLQTQGFDTSHVGVLDGKTSYGEIFVDPEGERTIMANGGRARTFMPSIAGVKADAAYINTILTSTELNEAAAATSLMVSQYPLHPIAPRPADVVIASRADLHGQEMGQFWQNVQGFAGERLASIIVTDGPQPVCAFDGEAETRVAPARRLASIDTTGAGDYFAGGYMDGILRGMSEAAAISHACALAAQRLEDRHNAKFEAEAVTNSASSA